MAMINVVGADMGMSVIQAKYHYLYWRPVTAIDPAAVVADGLFRYSGYDDGNPATVEQTGWRPLLTTPGHPEYPAAHGVDASAMAEVVSTFLGTNQIDLDIHGFDPAGPPGNLDAVRHFDTLNELPQRDCRRPILGEGCTTTSQASPALSSAAKSRNTTSGTLNPPTSTDH